MPTYEFSRRVRPGRLQRELTAALGPGVVESVTTGGPPDHQVVVTTSRELTAEERSSAVDVVQAHDPTEPEGSVRALWRLIQAAAPLEGRTAASLTAAERWTLVAVALAQLGLIDEELRVRIPPPPAGAGG